MSKWLRAFIASIVTLVVGCGGGGGSATAPSQTNALSPQGGATKARFTITVPLAGTQAKGRRPQYVSSSTQSVVITLTSVNGTPVSSGIFLTAQNLTPSNPACEGSPLTCTILVAATPGTDVFTVATYDAPQGTNLPAPVGNLLSYASIAIPIVAGQANAPSTPLVLNGVPASITVTPAGPTTPPAGEIAATNYLQGSVSGLKLWGQQAQTVTVNALDADGNIIVGSGAPALSLSSPSGTLTASGPNSNVFTLQATTSGTPAVVTPGNVVLTAAATPAAGSGLAALSVHVPVTVAHSALFIANTNSNNVLVFYDGNTTTPSLTITSGIRLPEYLALDASGNLYVSNCFSSCGAGSPDTVTEYLNGSTSVNLTITSGISNPYGLAVDTNGTLYVSNANANDFTTYLAGATTPNSTVTTGTTPVGIAVDANGTVYVVNEGSPSVMEFLAGATTPFATITGNGLNSPQGAGLTPNGTFLIANASSDNILQCAAGATTCSVLLSSITFPVGVHADVSGTVYVAEFVTNGHVYEYASGSSTVTTTISPGGGVTPDDVVVYPAPFVQ